MSIMFMKIRTFLVGFIASEEGVRKQGILPVAWVAAVIMAAAVVFSMPEKAHAGSCWTTTSCGGQSAYFCQSVCQNGFNCNGSAWACRPYPGTLQYRCYCSN